MALHRIAYLLYKHRDKITPENIIVFSPNNIFNDYISNVLSQLGEDNMYQTTFNDYMHKELDYKFKKETSLEMMEYILGSKEKLTYEDRIKSIKFKTSVEFTNILKEYINYIETTGRDFQEIVVRGKLVISSKEIKNLFFNDYSNLPIKRRLKKIKSIIEFLIESHEEAWINEIYQELDESGDYIQREEMIEISTLTVKKKLKSTYDKVSKMTEFN